MPQRSSSKEHNALAFSVVRQVPEGTRPPFSEVPAAMDNAALRKQVLREMGRSAGPAGGEARASPKPKARRRKAAKKAAKPGRKGK